jgi:hypothetical protein
VHKVVVITVDIARLLRRFGYSLDKGKKESFGRELLFDTCHLQDREDSMCD